MNLSDLPATLEQNKAAAAGVGAVAVIGFAMYQKRKTASAAPTADVGAALSAGSQTAAASGGAAYDSSASDLYGALQPQLEAIGQQLNQLANPTTIPTPAPPAPAPVVATPQAPTPTTIPQAVAAPAPSPQAPNGGPQYVTVVRGDTLSGIAARYPSASITARSIAGLNGISDPNKVQAGRQIRVY